MTVFNFARSGQFVFALIFGIGFARMLLAQPVGTSGPSLDTLVNDSTLIVRGTIEELSEHDPNDEYNFFYTINVKVLETLKGKPQDQLSFVQNADIGRLKVAATKAAKQEVLFFLVPWQEDKLRHSSDADYAYTRFPMIVDEAILLAPGKVAYARRGMPILTKELTELKNADEVTSAVKSIAKVPLPLRMRSKSIELPEELRGGAYRAILYVPDAVPPEAYLRKGMDLATFREKYGKKPPEEFKPRYPRHKSGYVGVYSVETMLDDCDVAVRCVVEDYCFVSLPEDPTGDAYGVKLRVLETFRGEPGDEITAIVYDVPDLEKFKRDKQEFVLFLRDNRWLPDSGSETALEYQARSGVFDHSAIILNEPVTDILFADLTWHTKTAEILSRLRVVGKTYKADEPAARYQTLQFCPPAVISDGSCLADNPHGVVYIPINAELETSALGWLKSEDKHLRWLGARALVYFKSDANAKALQPLLADDAEWTNAEVRLTAHQFIHYPKYLGRWEAWHILNGWGYAAEKPDFAIQRWKRP